jgi:hypothetical protein
MRARFSKDRVELRLPRADELALRGAAYVMTESAYAAIAGKRGARAVVLWPKAGVKLKDLARDFAREYDNQLLRWKLLRLNRKISAEVLERALELPAPTDTAVRDGSRKQPDSELLPARLREIEETLREAEKEAWDPMGIARPWEELRGDKK